MTPAPDRPPTDVERRLVVIGAGRAGRSLAAALSGVGWEVDALVGRDDDAVAAVADAGVVVIATPDAAVAGVSASLVGHTAAPVVHLAGSLGLGALDGHPRRGCLHPLVSLPTPEVGARRLVGAWFAVAGDPAAALMASDLGGRTIEVADEDRATYHAAACIAANHLVALMGQVERVAASAGLPLAPFVELASGALDNVATLGPRAALTGPAARGDDATLDRHRAALAPDELPAYDALVDAARRLAGAPEASSGTTP